MKCLYCGEYFTPQTIVQKYCSRSCGDKYRRKYGVQNDYPVIEFDCARCGRHVVTDGTPKDRRSRFCSKECEKIWWRHPPHENTSTRMNFRSVEEYAYYESRTND